LRPITVGLRLDAADAEAEHPHAVDHRRVRVGPDEGVGEGLELAVDLAGLHHRRQVLQVDLVDDAGAGGHRAEVAEGLLRPAQEHVALPVALVLALDVLREGLTGAEAVDLHGVVDHQVGRDQRVDQRRVAAEGAHGIAHGGEVDHAGDAGEVLHHHAGGQEGHLVGEARARPPGRQVADVVLGHEAPAAVAQHRLQQDLDRVRGARQILADGVQAVDDVAAPPRLERVACVERIRGWAHCGSPSGWSAVRPKSLPQPARAPVRLTAADRPRGARRTGQVAAGRVQREAVLDRQGREHPSGTRFPRTPRRAISSPSTPA
jgi:hypothetical protein